jgi:phosphate transport system substrate-binding protein
MIANTSLAALIVLTACASPGSNNPPLDAAPDTVDGYVVDSVVPETTSDADWHPTAPFAATVESYPRVDGATATLPLQMIAACEVLGVRWHWESASDSTTERYIQPEGPLADAIRAKIVHNQTHAAYMNLIDGTTDLVLQASPPSAAELAHATEMAVTLDAKPVALDALVVLVNPRNPVSGLTIEQVRQIYLGEATRWNEVGGLARPIHPYTRPTNSGSFELFNALILKGATMPDWPADLVIRYMGALLVQVASDEDAIGYSVYYYVHFLMPALGAGTKPMSINGVDPTSATIASRSYPLTAESWVVIRTNQPTGSHARSLRDWLLTPDGQRVVKMSGYVPVR